MELFLIACLACACAYLALRVYRTERALRATTDALQQDPTPTAGQLKLDLPSPHLSRLIREVLALTTETRLREERQTARLQFRDALLNQIEDALWILDDTQEIHFANRAAEQLFPVATAHIGRRIIEVCRDHRVVDTLNLALEVGAKTQERIHSTPHSGKADRERTFLLEAEPLTPDSGVGSGAWIIIRDITLQLETEQVRKDFIANASHELRTPLSIIAGYLEMMGDDPNLTEPGQQRALGTMSKHCDRLTRIVEDMLTISKLEATEDWISAQQFNLADCILDTVDQLQPLIDEEDVKVSLKIDPKDSPFWGDPFYWDQVFFNLIENAIKQNRGRPLKITVRVRHKNGRHQISVSDNGVGIPAADLPLIFKRFFRVEKHHAKTVKGTGLGLSIVKRAVEAHHGTITATSTPGVKTTFTISVPQPDSEPGTENSALITEKPGTQADA